MKPKAIRALQHLSAENAALFHKLRVFANSVHEMGELDRSLVSALDRDGAQTVPHLAKARGVSRQHVQTAINGLIEAKAVASAANPAHRRSNLLELTAAGRKLAESLREKEAEAMADFDLGIPAKEMESIADSLKTICKRLDKAAG